MQIHGAPTRDCMAAHGLTGCTHASNAHATCGTLSHGDGIGLWPAAVYGTTARLRAATTPARGRQGDGTA
jgi:hypothetical protein